MSYFITLALSRAGPLCKGAIKGRGEPTAANDLNCLAALVHFMAAASAFGERPRRESRGSVYFVSKS